MDDHLATVPATSRVKPSALPKAWIDALFEKLSLMYGNDWAAKWNGIPIDKVKASWAEDLAFASGDQLRLALHHCRTSNRFPPSCPEFAMLCKSFAPAPGGYPSALPAPRGSDIDPIVAAEITAWLSPGRIADSKQWAREILALETQGRYRSLHGIKCARIALGIIKE